MQLIGYARVSSVEQNLDRQLGALRAAGCGRIFAEKLSGKSTANRPELEKAIDALGTGWVFVVAEWDRATRSMFDGIQIMQRVAARGALIKVLDKPHLDLTGPVGRGLLAFLSAIAEDERERILSRARGGMEAARRRGVRFGRPHVLTTHQKQWAIERMANGEPHRAIARDLGVSHRTVGRLNGNGKTA